MLWYTKSVRFGKSSALTSLCEMCGMANNGNGAAKTPKQLGRTNNAALLKKEGGYQTCEIDLCMQKGELQEDKGEGRFLIDIHKGRACSLCLNVDNFVASRDVGISTYVNADTTTQNAGEYLNQTSLVVIIRLLVRVEVLLYDGSHVKA